MSDDKALNSQTERTIAQVRRLMMIAGATTFIALAAVLGVIGYRLFHLEGRASATMPFAEVTARLPPRAKVLSTAVSDGHILVTIELAGGVEVLTFDPDTLKPTGRLRLEQKP